MLRILLAVSVVVSSLSFAQADGGVGAPEAATDVDSLKRDLDAARKARIPIANNGGANSVAVAEHAVMLMLAIGAGISDGLGFGANTRVALITRGLHEIGRLATRLGAHPLTLAGLEGAMRLLSK